MSSRMADDSSAMGCFMALSLESGSLNAAANRRACSPQRRRKAAVNALERLALDCTIANLHPRRVAQRVVKVGPPRRCTMLSEVVAIGRSRFLTEAYAAEMEGMPTALRPTPRRNRAPASTRLKTRSPGLMLAAHLERMVPAMQESKLTPIN